MKKLFFIAMMLIASIGAFSQDFREVVYLKNGNVVKGDIIEFQPDKSLKIETVDGGVISFDYIEVDKIVRSNDAEATDSANSEFKKHYRGFVSAEGTVGKVSGVKLTTTHGWQLNKKLFLGLGTGIFKGTENYGAHTSFPLFANFRVDFLDKRFSPFADLRTGYDLAWDGVSGFYGDVSFGCRFNRFSVSLGLESINEKKVDVQYIYSDDVTIIDGYPGFIENIYGVRVFNAVARFSFEF